ncbi:hypothetical protein [uncultured Marivirga sp.]|mgnify:CR=1 FL=1|uniref:hypothetical protein n=1 Tax=uncultured Marivirga sp. TaxID=1123707 RepID=UPI0030EE7127|tara:strand:- start:215190 stop:215684 length:495 start_codon:yes stop_codon:yes gene_type:complete
MKILQYAFLLLLSLVFTSCIEGEKIKPEIEEKSVYPEYIIFGMFFGNCFPQDCIEIFKIQNDSLFKSDNTYPRDSLYSGEFEFIGNEKLSLVSDITDEIPSELLEIEDQYIGCPDCSDWGGFIIEYSTKEFQSNWLIDTRKSNVPEELHDFLNLTYDRIQILLN